MTKCYACKNDLKPELDENTDYQFDNALWIGLFGGDGMFIEDKYYAGEKETDIINNASKEAVICHECAHDLCEKVEWLNKLIEPFTSHAHRSEFWKNNPEHEGWDKPVSEF